MSVGQIWRKRDRPFEACESLLWSAGLRQSHPKQEMRLCASRIDRERLPRICDPLPQVPRLAGGERQPVKLIGLDHIAQVGPLPVMAALAVHSGEFTSLNPDHIIFGVGTHPTLDDSKLTPEPAPSSIPT